jgi:3'-phosphoadenosine 5'-phosphosulfate sulfotransferase (PAPS reductase)/FAD synthetase
MVIETPAEIQDALAAGATLVVSVSGGKDSQAMLMAVMAEHRRQMWPGDVLAIHAHLGRMEWPQTLAHCEAMCAAAGVPLTVVSRPQGDLLQEMWDRVEKLRGTGKPPFPDAKNRYCTSDQKRNQIDRVLRAAPFPDSKNRYCTSHHKTNQIDKELRKHTVIISAEGIRADESPARSKRPVWEYRQQICTKQRTAYTWRPLLHWTEADVWEQIGHTTEDVQRRRELYRQGDHGAAFDGWRTHPAYVVGNQRLSCAMCVLASRADITNGARHNPELYAELVRMEQESGFSFRQDLNLGSLFSSSAPAKKSKAESCQLCMF